MTAPATTAVQTAGVDPAIGAAIDVYRRLDTIRNVLAPDLNDQELQLFAIVAERSRLDPFAKQIYAIKRKGRVTFQTGIDGFRSSAEDTGEYRGSDEPEYGPTIDKPFPHPEWARVVVHRQFGNGERLDQPATAYFDEMYPGDDQGFQWRKMPRVMIAKCAEAAAFRKAFPKRFADVYTPEEMDQASAADAARPVAPTARDRIATRRAELEAQHPQAGGPVADEAAQRSNPAPAPATTATGCEVASPKGEPCTLPLGHSGSHHAGVKSWPTPKQTGTSGNAAPVTEHRVAGDSEPGSEGGTAATASVAVPDPSADVAEGEFTEVGDEPVAPACTAEPPKDHPLGMTAMCMEPAGHTGAHKSAEGSWPQTA
jgi:phage recombination protein Bet